MKKIDIIIIGAGPAGLSAAISSYSPSILVLEKKNNPGRKLLISASTKCNVTHSGEISNFFSHYGLMTRFVKPSLLNFTNDDLISFLKTHNIPCIATEDGKIFPSSLNARDILNALINECRQKKVVIHTSESVSAVERVSNKTFLCITQHNRYSCKRLILATGGKSYPQTGSTGDGYSFARSLGHTIIQPKPALVSISVKQYPLAHVSGISLKNTLISLWRHNKKIKKAQGDILFTHHGVSGPVILNLSRYIEQGDTLKISFIADDEQSRKKFTNLFSQNGRMKIATIVNSFDIPRNLANALIDLADIPANMRGCEITKHYRLRLFEILSGLPLEVESTGGFDKAIVTKGGICCDEVYYATMESKLVPGLYFAGEVLDVDGDEGGYNIQFAFSSGVLAGTSRGKV